MDVHNQEPTAFGGLDSAELQDAGDPSSAVRGRGVAQVLVPDASGVVVLPAGTELGDIRIEGRDLVVIGADGVRYVIPDGAIVVPQLVVGDVVIPPLNLAALLIGNEPQPAAGNPQSSGGNFASPVGPLQDAYGLGDLLPYTELTFPEPEEAEVIPQPLDRDPLITVFTPDQPAGVQNATATVAEAGLPARNGEPAGSNAAATSEVTSGTFVINSPDGIASLTINGTPFTGAGQTFTTPRGTLLITSYDPATGVVGFTYTLTDNLIGNTVADQFVVTVTDPDGDVATGSLTVTATDDAPTARNDTDSVPAATYTAQTGNVITGVGTTSGAAGADTLGADNASITRIASSNVTANADTTFDASGNLQVAGQYGTLLIKADGSYSYTRAAGTPGGVSDAFSYTLTDADGSASSAVLTIAIADAAPVITSVPPANDFAAGTLVFEAGLPSRSGEAPGTNASAPTETTSGTVTFTGGDGPVTATINGVAVAPGAVVTIPGVGTLTVNTFSPATGAITYSFTLADNTAGDTTSVTFNIVVTDVDGDTAPGTFTIAIRDDTPIAANDSATQAVENAPVIVNLLGNDTQGADSVQASTVSVVAGTLTGTGTLTNNADGTVTYTPGPGESGTVTFDYTITDGDGDVSRATATIALLADSTPTIAVAGDNTVDEAALADGSNAASSDETAAGTVAITTGGDTLASLVINGINVTAGGTVTTAKGVLTVSVASGAYSYSYTLTDNTLADPDSDTFSLVVTDSDGDTASTSLVIAIADDTPTARDDAGAVAAGAYGPISGSVTANDTPGADGIVVTGYAGVTSGSVGATVNGQYGTLTIAADGTYSYTRNAGTPGGVSDSFTYTVRDGDGDTSTAKLVIAIADSGTTLTLPAALTPGVTQVLEAGLGTGAATGSAAAGNGEFASGSFTFTAPDGPAVVTIGGTTITATGQTVTGSFGTLTVTSIAPGSIGYSYELTTNTAGDATADAFAVTITDQDGDAAAGTLSIAIVDDIPTARDDGPFSPLEDTAIVIDVLANDTRGADGVVNATAVAIATGPTKGSVAYNGDGTFTYTPTPGQEGDDSFTYTITDGDGDPSTATVRITLAADSTPTIEVAGDNTVSEAALGARPGEPAGSNAASSDETATGTISITTGNDTIASLVINGQDVTGGGVVNTAKGVLTVSFVAGVYGYSYTLTDNTLSDPDSDVFSLTVNDSDGDAATTSLVIAIADDTPAAFDDAGSVAAGTYGPIAGDVRANDTQGADGAVVVSYNGVSSGGAGDTVQGQYGTLTISADGSYSYSRNAGTPGGVSDTFNYTIRDGDGDQATAKLVIAIADSGTTLTLPPAVTPGVTQVFEAGLGTPTATGSNAAGNGEFASGTVTFTAPDGPAAITIGGVAVTAVNQTFTGSFGTLTITSIGSGSIGYTYELTTNTGGDSNSDTFVVKVTDQDGEFSESNLTIAIVDDVPTARADGTFDVAEQTPLKIDVFVNDTAGADGVVLDGAVALTTGPTKGSVVYNADGTFTYTPNAGAEGADSFTYTITDGDGDPSTATVTLNLLADSTPVFKTSTNLAVDEDGFGTANVDATPLQGAPAETNGDENLTDTSGVAVFDFKADVPAVLAGSAVLVDTDALDGQLVTLTGQDVVFKLEGGALVGRAGSDAGAEVIRITLTGATAGPGATEVSYTYSTTLSQPVRHTGVGTEDLATLTGVTIEVTDLDNDKTTGTFDVTVRDDVPTAAPDTDSLLAGATGPATGNVITDNDPGDTGDGDNGKDELGADGGSVTAVTGFGGAGTIGGTTTGKYGTLTLNADGSYSYSRTGTGPVNDTDTFTYTLTDGDGDTAQATLTITLQDAGVTVGANNIVLLDDDALSGIAGGTGDDPDAAFTSGTLSGSGGDGTLTFAFATTGAPTDFSYQANGTGIDVFQGVTKVLTITLGANSGAYTVTQNAPIKHANGADENNQAFTLSYTVTDADGDSAGGTLKIDVDDDTPTANVVISATITDDEGKAPFASSSIEGATVGTDVAGSPATATGAAGALFATGADGFGSLSITPPTLLKAITTGTASGTTGTSRQEDVAYDAPTVAVNGAVTITARGVTSGAVVFTLTVNPDGSYSFTQSRALVHPAAGEDNKALNFAFTLTDKDGDTAAGSLRIDVNDDTPTNFTPATATATNTGTAVISNQVLDTAGGIFDNAGADGIASITFSSAINGTKLSGPSGLLKSGGSDIFLYIQANGSLIASTDADPTNGLTAGTTVFTATLNAATGTYTIDFDKTIDNGSGTKVADFSKAGAGNTPWKGVDADLVNGAAIALDAANDPNPDSTDLLFTPSVGGTINSDSDDIGISNQFIDADEFLRVDLVQDLRFDPGKSTSDADGYLYDTHVGVTQFTFKIIQVQSNPNATAAVRISAANVDDGNAISQSNVGDATINTAVNLDHTTVQVRDAAGVLVTTGIFVFNEGNDIVVTGVKTGYTVSFGAQANATFEAVRIENAAGDPKAVGPGNYAGDNFAVGGFAFSSVAIGAPVSFSLPVVLTDGDGDTSTGNIAVTLNPVTPVVLDLDGDGVEFIDSSAGAVFDYNGDGNGVATAWAGRDDGILAFDANGNGRVDSGAEIVFGFDGKTDLEGLAARYDTNHDGVLDAADADFARFGVWQDANGDGVSDAGEFRLLGDAGIVSISLTSDGKAYTAANGEVSVSGSGTYTKADGTLGKLADAAFATNARATQRTAEMVTTAAVAGAIADAAFAAAQPAAVDGEQTRALPKSEVTRVALEDADAPAARSDGARADLFAEPTRHDDSHIEAASPIRGETGSARLALDGWLDDAARAPDYFGTADAGPRHSIGGMSLVGSTGGDGMMHALLSMPAANGARAALPDQAAAAIGGALSDFTGEATVDAMIDHFSPTIDGPGFAMIAGDNGMHLLMQDLTGSALATRFAANQDMNDDAQALLMAQA